MTTDNLQTRPRMKYAYEQLQRMAQQLGPNAQLPTMVQLRESLGVSMHTLNEAVREMERQGVLRSVHGVGIFVAEPQKPLLTGNIGLIAFSNDLQTPKAPFHIHLKEAITQAVTEAGQNLLHMGIGALRDENACHKVDGILLSCINTEQIAKSLPPGFPVVSLLNTAKDVSSVGIDEYLAGRMAALHLVEHGHRRIACLMEKSPIECRHRLVGVSDVLREAGIEQEANWLRLTENAYDVFPRQSVPLPYRQWGRAEMNDWLRSGWAETGCTALIVQNELAAISVLQELQAANIKVPEEVSIITFDGTEVCNLVSPSISAVAIPLEQIGIRAVELLNRQILGECSEAQTVTLPLQLRAGESVASVNAATGQAEKILIECG